MEASPDCIALPPRGVPGLRLCSVPYRAAAPSSSNAGTRRLAGARRVGHRSRSRPGLQQATIDSPHVHARCRSTGAAPGQRRVRSPDWAPGTLSREPGAIDSRSSLGPTGRHRGPQKASASSRQVTGSSTRLIRNFDHDLQHSEDRHAIPRSRRY